MYPQRGGGGGNRAVPSTSTSDDDDDDLPNFTIKVKKLKTEVKKFRSREISHEIRLQFVQNSAWRDHLNFIGRALDTSLTRATADLDDNDLVRVFVHQNSLETPIVLKLDKKTKCIFPDSFEWNWKSPSVKSQFKFWWVFWHDDRHSAKLRKGVWLESKMKTIYAWAELFACASLTNSMIRTNKKLLTLDSECKDWRP